MENTLENKAKFFAQYYGQDVLKASSVQGIHKVGRSFMGKIYHDQYLELKPISSISDGDAIEVCKMAIPYTGRYELLEVRKTSIVFKLPFINSKYQVFPLKSRAIHLETYKGGLGVVEIDQITPIFNSIAIIDYLRSRGYAVPWMGLSVEKLIEYSWIKLNED
ncbi:hypothetical protein [Sphingobacterium sp. UBA6645]|uniref:hypothetical protein n=1 Tax=Sphingobacterium sp. UBA6645 TaxID=1947511 RepID=UPI0025ED56D5|nr:hypothetical protein [Sphingobacterium sp. UBA6645]